MWYGKCKQAIAAWVMGIFLGLATTIPVHAAVHPPDLSAKAAILVDGSTGQILFGHDVRGEFYPASITKIMTAYLAITHGWHRTVTVSRAAELQQGASAYLLAGQRLPMPKVVTAMMLVSGNDAAYAVAQTVAGSVPAFVRLMNAQARAWHAPGIHFVNPDGLPNGHHVVSALGMAIIAEHAMKNPIFARIVDTQKSTLPPDPHPRIYYNQNRLLYDYPGAVGIKIGYTIEADETIVSAARRHGLFLIGVLLHDTPAGLWPDAENLLTWGFDHFHAGSLVRRGQPLGFLDIGGRRVPVEAARTIPYVYPNSGAVTPSFFLKANRPHSGRLIRKNALIGAARIAVRGHSVGRVPLLSVKRVLALPPRVHRNWWWLLLPLAVAGALSLPRWRDEELLRKRGASHG